MVGPSVGVFTVPAYTLVSLVLVQAYLIFQRKNSFLLLSEAILDSWWVGLLGWLASATPT
jgi:hypothetical protein